MKLKIKTHEKSNMVFTGSKVLRTIADTYTPNIDLLIRESIQNSLDAVLDESSYCRMNYIYGTFNNSSLYNSLDGILLALRKKYNAEKYEFLAISDDNTCGLLGDPYPNEDSKYKNLYNLVYDFMNGKTDENAGGSWGVGKSVYYRFGNGLVFYYSRTFENNKYINKLAGAFIQDESKEECLLGRNSSGIAFFGDLDQNGKSIPIYDDNEIKEFLNIFGLSLYEEDKTGTTVIIPYFDKEQLLNFTINDTNEPWKENVEEALKVAIQRWYFPRLNNNNYNGKYLKCAVNNKLIELNAFFKKLQDLYMGKIEDAHEDDICINKKEYKLGCFRHKKFKKIELGVESPPEYLSNPYVLVDKHVDLEDKNPALLFYTRKPGMIITYDPKNLSNFQTDDDEYIIGVFILNDELTIDGEKLGSYIRGTEIANHKEWTDSNLSNFPVFTSKKPFSKICSSIKKNIKDSYFVSNVDDVNDSSSYYQRILGQLLLPPEDYGDEPTLPKRNGGGSEKSDYAAPRKKKVNWYFSGFEYGMLLYIFEFTLKPQEIFSCKLKVKASSKIYSFDEWIKLGFDIPCKLHKLEIMEYTINKESFNKSISITDDFFKRYVKRDQRGNDLFAFKAVGYQSKDYYGIDFENKSKSKMAVKLGFYVKPIDITYSIDFDAIITGGNSNE